jgi:hypothetical protein
MGKRMANEERVTLQQTSGDSFDAEISVDKNGDLVVRPLAFFGMKFTFRRASILEVIKGICRLLGIPREAL